MSKLAEGFNNLNNNVSADGNILHSMGFWFNILAVFMAVKHINYATHATITLVHLYNKLVTKVFLRTHEKFNNSTL